jgi:hypothetical protein
VEEEAAPPVEPRQADPAPRRTPPQARVPHRAPPERSTFYARCTEQCHLSCEASFEACNRDASPAKPECVRKLEACRVEQCSCRFQ